MRTRLAVTLLASVALLGCGDQGESGSASVGDGYVTDASTDPDLMQASPDVVRPGDDIEAVFPRGSNRGPGFVLERAAGEDWESHYAISSDTDARDMGNTSTAEELITRNVEWGGGPTFDATDPHLIPIPDGAEPGRWRVCTFPDTLGLCAEFEIRADGASPP